MTKRPDEIAGVEVPDGSLAADIARVGEALITLGDVRGPGVPRALAHLVQAVAEEAMRTPRFSLALQRALNSGTLPVQTSTHREPPRRTGRRDPGVLDPFAVYSQGSEMALREQLAALTLEQLRDIVAEHGMDHDRLAMKWKDAARVIDRIVERVVARVAKGSAFRGEVPDHG